MATGVVLSSLVERGGVVVFPDVKGPSGNHRDKGIRGTCLVGDGIPDDKDEAGSDEAGIMYLTDLY